MLSSRWRIRESCLAVVGVCLSACCLAQDAAVERPEPEFVPKITISEGTTWVTEPLGPNGGVDYVALFNQRAARGVTLENNAAVILSRALGPAPVGGEQVSDRYYELLGIDPLPKEGPYFEDLSKWWNRKGKKLPKDGKPAYWISEEQANARPWTPRVFPDLVEWLADMEAPLRVALEASERTEYFSPLPENADEALCRGSLSVQTETRMVSRALVTRAMLRLGEENRFEAWNDLLVSHRLARLIGRGTSGMDGMVGHAAEYGVITGELQLISATRPSSKFTSRYLKQLGQLPPLSPIIDKIDGFERAMYLDACQQLARDRLSKDDFGDDSDAAWLARFAEHDVRRQVDWDVVLRIGNRRFDQLVAAIRRPTYREREAALRPLDEEFTAMAERRQQAAELFMSLKGPMALTALTSDVMCSAWVPRIRLVHRSETAARQRLRNLEIALALSTWRGDLDSYPESLTDLVPKYLAAVPLDLFTDQPLRYTRTADGYRFYSVGPNGTDDQGRNEDDMPRGDDLAVQMPMPLPKLKP